MGRDLGTTLTARTVDEGAAGGYRLAQRLGTLVVMMATAPPSRSAEMRSVQRSTYHRIEQIALAGVVLGAPR
jgi:hypothetical protein